VNIVFGFTSIRILQLTQEEVESMKSVFWTTGVLLLVGLLTAGCAKEEVKVEKHDRGTIITMQDINFEFGKAELMPAAMQTIDPLVERLRKNPERNLLIEGFTDSIGNDQYNMKLSLQRANAVRDALTARGISAGRITTKGYGKQFPVESNDTPEGRQMNRRVEIIILNEGVSAEQAARKH
jgi:outer membrane protein OmpA-like peptidoglycan-associated protein